MQNAARFRAKKSGRKIEVECDELLQFHPHIHAIVSDGGFLPDGAFVQLPPLDAGPILKLWQQKVFALLLGEGKIDQALVNEMRAWPVPGSVAMAARISPRGM